MGYWITHSEIYISVLPIVNQLLTTCTYYFVKIIILLFCAKITMKG